MAASNHSALLDAVEQAVAAVTAVPAGSPHPVAAAEVLYERIFEARSAGLMEQVDACLERAREDAMDPARRILISASLQENDLQFRDSGVEGLDVCRIEFTGTGVESPQLELRLVATEAGALLPKTTRRDEQVLICVATELQLMAPNNLPENRAEELHQRGFDYSHLQGLLTLYYSMRAARRLAWGLAMVVLSDQRVFGVLFEDRVPRVPDSPERDSMPVVWADRDECSVVAFSAERRLFDSHEIIAPMLGKSRPYINIIGDCCLAMDTYMVVDQRDLVVKPGRTEIADAVRRFMDQGGEPTRLERGKLGHSEANLPTPGTVDGAVPEASPTVADGVSGLPVGAERAERRAEASRPCPSCGAPVSTRNRFCTLCGAQAGPTQSPTEVESSPTAVQPPAKPPLGGWGVVVILFGFVGGLIGWASLRGSDPARASRVLRWGVVVSATSVVASIAVYVLLAVVLVTSVPSSSDLMVSPAAPALTAQVGDGATGPASVPGSAPTAISDAALAAVSGAQISAGESHTCALLRGGVVRCWGYGENGQLGSGATDNLMDEPGEQASTVDLGAPATQISAGWQRTCALLQGGVVRCWGEGEDGQLGSGATDNLMDEPGEQASTVDLGAPATQISAGWQHTCVLLQGGAVRCWGRGGQLGSESLDSSMDEPGEQASTVDLGAPATQISAGGEHTCVLLQGGAVRCWGWGGVGSGSTAHLMDEPGEQASTVDLGAPATQISAGSSHTCALLESGAVRCWGIGSGFDGNDGRLGSGAADDLMDEPGEQASNVDLGAPATQISAGGDHTCALLQGGAVRCWGGGFAGRLGSGSIEHLMDEPGEQPSNVDLGAPATQISAGGEHTCALLQGGAVRCWGDGLYGQLGSGSPADLMDEAGEQASTIE